mgnify:CR=1 FL=1
MNKEKKTEILKSLQDIVTLGCFYNGDKCECTKDDNTHKCDKGNKYIVFVGGTNLSNLISASCEDHLHIAVDNALKYQKEQYEKQIDLYEINEIKKAMELLDSKKDIVRRLKLKKLTK